MRKEEIWKVWRTRMAKNSRRRRTNVEGRHLERPDVWDSSPGDWAAEGGCAGGCLGVGGRESPCRWHRLEGLLVWTWKDCGLFSWGEPFGAVWWADPKMVILTGSGYIRMGSGVQRVFTRSTCTDSGASCGACLFSSHLALNYKSLFY